MREPDPIILAVHAADCGCSSLVHPEPERWDYYARIADAVRATMHTEHGLVFAADVTDVRVPMAAPGTGPEQWVRQHAADWRDHGAAVYVREVTDWRPEDGS